MYTPLKLQSRGSKYNTSLMPTYGVNKDDLSQVMNIKYALDIVNYIPYSYGLRKRKGLSELFEIASTNPGTLLKKFTSDRWIFAYDTTVCYYDESTDIVTNIKTNFTSNSGFNGDKYGDYFLICNGVDKIWRIDSSYAISEITASPICDGLKFIGKRCYAFGSFGVQYSDIDDGTDPPFDNWNESTANDEGGLVSYRNAGTVKSVCQLGENTVAFSDDGFFAFRTETVESGGSLLKTDYVQNYTQDFGGARGAIETPLGIFYVNEGGLWQMLSVGATDQPMSRQQANPTKLLGAEYFENIDLSNADIVYDLKQKIILITCAIESTTNNTIICVKPELKNAVTFFNNWNINRFAKDDNVIYGCSSTEAVVYKLFDGFDDDGLAIGTIYQQEIPLKTLFYKNQLNGLYAGGFLTPDDELTISIDIYNESGEFQQNKAQYLWTGVESSSKYDEFGLARFGGSEFGGSIRTSGMVESFGGGSPRVNNLQRLQIRIEGGSKTEHILNWISIKTKQKQPIRRRNITKI